MNPENFKNTIDTRIETNNLDERNKELSEKMVKISLVYADKRFQKIKVETMNYKFSSALRDFTPTKNEILQPTFDLEGFHYNKEDKKKIKIFLKDFYNEVDFIYDNEGLKPQHHQT